MSIRVANREEVRRTDLRGSDLLAVRSGLVCDCARVGRFTVRTRLSSHHLTISPSHHLTISTEPIVVHAQPRATRQKLDSFSWAFFQSCANGFFSANGFQQYSRRLC